MSSFYNRKQEITDLTSAWEDSGAKLRLLYGRRRVGKTCLLQHFLSDGRPHCYFLASAMTITGNLERLAQALIKAHPRHPDLTPASL
ncbi:MAG: hypothetical protein PHT33_13885, partial [bacterium]|nr:hypothetical protein [bacterium]